MLNPYSDYGKELLPKEVENILKGTISSGGVKNIKFDNQTNIRIGIPAVYPTKIVASLVSLFSSLPSVNKAYLAFIEISDGNDAPHYIFGIDCNGDWKSISNRTGYVIKEHLQSNEFVDIVKVGEKNDINDYLTGTKPFYKRK